MIFFRQSKTKTDDKNIKKENRSGSDGKIQRSVALIDLTQLASGKSAKVVELRGGREVVGKLEAMGIVPGTIIIKKSAILAKGPIILAKGEVQFAIGYAMAQKIFVETITKKIMSLP